MSKSQNSLFKIISFLSALNLIFSFSLGIFPIYESNYLSCGKYKCEPDQQYCASSKISPELQITLSPICKNNEYCDIGGNNDPNDVFYQQKEVKGTCKPLQYKPNIQRYPGEECNTDDDCVKPVQGNEELGKCINNKCSGVAQFDKCENTESCLVGSFCSSRSKRCEPQKTEFENCDSSYECANNLLCYQGQCQNVLFSLPIGTKIKEKNIKADYYCKFGLAKNNICVKLVGNSEYTECRNGEGCVYSYLPSEQGQVSLPCECGYNEEGKGYCPSGHGKNTEAWEKYFKIMQLKYDNNCHTYSRFNCYKNEIEFIKMLKECENELGKGNRYEKSVECASQVFRNLN